MCVFVNERNIELIFLIYPKHDWDFAYGYNIYVGCPLPLLYPLLEQDGYSPLHIAAEKNAKEVAELLVRNGANVNQIDGVRKQSGEDREIEGEIEREWERGERERGGVRNVDKEEQGREKCMW